MSLELTGLSLDWKAVWKKAVKAGSVGAAATATGCAVAGAVGLAGVGALPAAAAGAVTGAVAGFVGGAGREIMDQLWP